MINEEAIRDSFQILYEETLKIENEEKQKMIDYAKKTFKKYTFNVREFYKFLKDANLYNDYKLSFNITFPNFDNDTFRNQIYANFFKYKVGDNYLIMHMEYVRPLPIGDEANNVNKMSLEYYVEKMFEDMGDNQDVDTPKLSTDEIRKLSSYDEQLIEENPRWQVYLFYGLLTLITLKLLYTILS